MKRFLSVFSCICVIVILMFSITSCDDFDFGSLFNSDNVEQNDNGHQHTFATKWTRDDTHHWYSATCNDYESCSTAKLNYAKHTFKFNQCTVCFAPRPCNHIYDDGCDVYCNLCNAIREPQHIYDNACDDTCNNCFVKRSVRHALESDDNDCTTPLLCKVCGVTMVEANTDHSFTTECDTSCNTDGCGHIRKTEHTYTNACAAACSNCGYIRTAPHLYGTNNFCNICEYGTSTNPKNLDIPGTLTFRYAPDEDADPVWYKFKTTDAVTISIKLSVNTIMGYGTDTDEMSYTNGSDTDIEFSLAANTTYYLTFATADSAALDISAAIKFYRIGTNGEKVEMPLYGKEIINFGDSIFGNNNSSTSVSNQLHLASGATVYNCAFGGTRLHPRRDDPNDINAIYRHFDMRNIIDAILTKNFAAQEEALTPVNGEVFNARFPEMLERIKGLEINDQIITLNHGTNDWTGGTSINNYKATLKYIITRIQENYPNAHIVLISPTWRCTLENDVYIPGGNDTLKYPNGTNYDFAVAMGEVAAEMGVDFINCYDIGINASNAPDYFDGNDGTHHNANGRELLAKYIAKELAKLIK